MMQKNTRKFCLYLINNKKKNFYIFYIFIFNNKIVFVLLKQIK